MKTPQELYNKLSYYTLARTDPSFIHQHIVDAFTAQQADKETKPIAITFALIGLYLYLEKNYTGRQVQLAHMQIAKKEQNWPKFDLPENRGTITLYDVVATEPGEMRDSMIHKWCMSVWEAYEQGHEKVVRLTKSLIFNS